MGTPIASDAPVLDGPAARVGLESVRRRTLDLVREIPDADLERVHSPLMSPLVWDLGHIAAYEELWLVQRWGGERSLRPELAGVYDAIETPRAVRGEARPLPRQEALDYLERVRERTLAAIDRLGVGDGTLHELVIQHEHQHNETMLQTLGLARLASWNPPARQPAPAAPGGHTGLELVDGPSGTVRVGADAAHGRFSYDNERRAHEVTLEDFRIGRTPVTNGAWLEWARAGGYEREEWWSPQGWRWRMETSTEAPAGWEKTGEETTGEGFVEWRLGEAVALDPDRPVIHVSWFEADAFARAHGARLPTEAEWEAAACWDPDAQDRRLWPWGGQTAGGRANLLDGGVYGTAGAGCHPEGASPCGALGMIGDVWEWTATDFGGYPGFVAHPYREYSEVFFGTDYKVLRGGSWASCERVATPTFRNWDFAPRRQIFAGVRLAKDA
jgi:iron(II)-dependent oxidoreductase